MKKSFIILSLLLVMEGTYAQCIVRGITTNPDAPINNERPSKTNTFFDWRSQYYQVNSAYISGTQIESPFYQGYQNINVFELYENKDMLPDDGWELITYNLGINENGTLKNPPPDYVHLVLYNKRTGILRVFLSGDNNAPFNGARVMIGFANGAELLPSTLSDASSLLALDKFESDPQILSVTRYLNGNGKWFYADFQMSYDVCTCLFESVISVSVDLIQKATIDLAGSFSGEIASIENGTGSVSQTGFGLKEVIEAGKKAYKSYKSISEFVNDQEKALGIAGKTNLELSLAQLFKRNDLNSFQTAIEGSEFLQDGLAAAPYIAAAVEFVKFFVGGGKKNPGPQVVKVMPMSINAKLDLKGELLTSYPYMDILFYTPGSKNTEVKDANLYPYYNEILGVLNLFSTPQMKYSYDQGTGLTMAFLSKEIEYVINPAAGFDLAQSEVYGSIIMKNNAGVIVSETGFYPISALKYITLLPGYPFTAELKILGNFRPTGGGQTQNVLLVSSFPINTTMCGQCSSPFGMAKLYLGLPNNDLIVNTIRSSSTFAITAMNSITVAPGGTILASNLIAIPQAVRDLQNYPKSLPQPNATAITDFCNGPLYAGDPIRSSAGARLAKSREINAISEESSNVSVFPNPNEGSFNLRIGTKTPGKLLVRLMSSNGTLVGKIFENNMQPSGIAEVNYQNSDLKPGLYLCVIESTAGTTYKKIIVR